MRADFCLASEECVDSEGCYNERYHEEDIKDAIKLLRKDYKALPDHTEKYLNKRLRIIFGDALCVEDDQ